MKRPFPKNSATGATEKSDQLQTTGSHEENTKMEKPDVKSWMKNYKKQRIGGKSNEETLSRSTPRRKTVYQRSKEKESHIEETHSNKVYEEMEERPKAKQTSEERMGGGESGEDLENCDIEDLESNKGHVQAADGQEQGRMDREESSANAPTNQRCHGGNSEGECIWPGIRGTVESMEDKSEEACICQMVWPQDLGRYSVAIHKPSFDFDENLNRNLC